MARPIQLVLVSHEFPPHHGGGIGAYAAAAAAALAATGEVDVRVLTPQPPGWTDGRERRGAVLIERLAAGSAAGPGRAATLLRFSAAAAARIAALHARGDADLSEHAECNASAFFAALPPPRDRPAVLVHLHTPSEALAALGSFGTGAAHRLTPGLAATVLAERAALRRADAVLSPSAFLADWAEAAPALPRPAVIPYPHRPAPIEAARVGPGGDPVVLYAGRLERRKGVEVLAEAWRRVLGRHPRARLELAGADTQTGTVAEGGGGSMAGRLRAVLDGTDALQSVRFLGALSPRALSRRVASATACVVPSLWENFPNTCLDAMAAGKPVVVADHGGMRELADGGAGLVVPAGDAAALGEALAGLLAEPAARLAERGARGRARVRARCDPARVAARRVQHLRETLAAHRGRWNDSHASQIQATPWERSAVRRLAAGEPVHPPALPLPAEVAAWLPPPGGEGTSRGGGPPAGLGAAVSPRHPVAATRSGGAVELRGEPAACLPALLRLQLLGGRRRVRVTPRVHPPAAISAGDDAATELAVALAGASTPDGRARRWAGAFEAVATGGGGGMEAAADPAQRLGDAFAGLAARGRRRVGVFGAGAHTRRAGPAFADPPVDLACVVDDDPGRRGGRLFGLPILDRARALALDPPLEALVLSSDAHEEALWHAAAGFRAAGVEVLRVVDAGGPGEPGEPGEPDGPGEPA